MKHYVTNSEELKNALKNAVNSSQRSDIYLKKGRYEISEPLMINGKNIFFHGEKNTIIAASKRISISDCAQYRDGIVKYDLKNNQIGEIREISGGPYSDYWFDFETNKPYLDDYCLSVSLFHKNLPLVLARYPKQGYIGIKNLCGKTKTHDPYGKVTGCKEGVFEPDDETALTWNNEENCILVGCWMFNWAMQRQRIEEIKGSVIRLEKPEHAFGYGLHGQFYGLNLLSQLNSPGEWYIDIKNSVVYIIPKKNQTYFDITTSKNIFIISESNGIHFENIIFEQCSQTAFLVNNCNNITLDDCTVRNAGGWGIIAENCCDFKITSCLFTLMGGGGVALGGGDRNSLTSSNNKIGNCRFNKLGNWHKVHTPAVQISGVGACVENNVFHSLPNTAVLFHGNNHLITGNSFTEVCLNSNDCGAIYGGKDWSCRGNEICYNYFNSIKGYKKKWCISVYFDDCFSSAYVHHNTFYECTTGILIGGGRDFLICKNTFCKCKSGIYVDCRLDNWASKAESILKESLNSVDYKNKIWQKAYPDLMNILNENYHFPENNKVEDNTFICETPLKLLDTSEKYTKLVNNHIF